MSTTAGPYTAREPAGLRASAAALLGESPVVLPLLLAVAVLLTMAASDGGFYPVGSAAHEGLGWLPAILAMVVVLAIAAGALGWPSPSRPTLILLGLFAGFTAWSYLSIAWAEQQGTAWAAANRTAFYLVLLCLFSLWPVGLRAARLVIGAFGFGVAALGVIELVRANGDPDPLRFFIDARFSEPVGYINANAALWSLGLWPCLWLAARREAPVLLRGLGLGGAGVLACCALLAQSRTWLVALPVALAIALVLTPGRLRLALAALAVGVGAFAVSGPVLAVHDEYDEARFGALLSDAVSAILLLGAFLAFVGLAAAVADRRVRRSPSRERAVSMVAAGVAAAVLLAGAGAYLAKEGSPLPKVRDAWHDFKKPSSGPRAGGSRFTSSHTNRYDFWRVAWNRSKDEPLRGIGAENFQLDYLQRGRSSEQPRYPHSLELEVLLGTGLVGALLLGGAFLAGVLGALASFRRMSIEVRAVAALALTVFAYWLLHASIDWFWAFPAITGPALAMLGIAGAIRSAPQSREAAGPLLGSPVARWIPRIAAGLALVAIVTSTVPLWWSERESARAAEAGVGNADLAYRRLDRAADLNPLSTRPHLLAAAIAIRAEDQARAARELREALRIEPRTAYALTMLGAITFERGRKSQAEALLARAARFAPRSEIIGDALRQVRRGRSVSALGLGTRYRKQAESRSRVR